MKRTLLAALLLGGSVVPAALALAAPAEAAACTGSSGVTVVVQFPDHTEIGCAAGDPSSGYAALQAAGFTITYSQGNGAGAICKINNAPGDAVCGSMPPANAYWAYFHAKPGGSWSYSSTGGGAYNPKPGTVEGWRFGDGDKPDYLPPGTSTPTPKPSSTPKPASSATPKPGTGTTAGSVPGTTATPGSPTSTGTTTAGPSASSSASSGPDATPGPTPTLPESSGSAVAWANAPDPDAAPTDGGISWLWGLGLLAVLGAAGAAVANRRRG